MSQSSAASPDTNRRAHRARVRTVAKAEHKGNRAYMRTVLGQHRNAGRGQRRRAYPMPVHPTVISAAIRAAHTEAGATDHQMRAVRRHVDRQMTA